MLQEISYPCEIVDEAELICAVKEQIDQILAEKHIERSESWKDKIIEDNFEKLINGEKIELGVI